MTSSVKPVSVKKKLLQKAKYYSHNKCPKYDSGHLQSDKINFIENAGAHFTLEISTNQRFGPILAGGCFHFIK